MSSESKKSNGEGAMISSEMPFSHSPSWNVVNSSMEPLYNMMVGAEEVVLTIDLPYVNQKLVKLSCPADDIIEVSADTSRKITFKDLGIKHRHGEFMSYHAMIRTPVPVDERKTRTSFKRGVLVVHLPRLK
jgi:HSP20 family molecular chaperone IbpA